ncbi:hypothetical protein [Pseudoflavonifractor sp. An176]|nr:hypothetical protein [Pseudoflavonifractor sp. An176]
MKKLFMEPEVKITKFEDEDLMRTSGVIVDPNPDVPGGETDFE